MSPLASIVYFDFAMLIAVTWSRVMGTEHPRPVCLLFKTFTLLRRFGVPGLFARTPPHFATSKVPILLSEIPEA